MSDVLDSMLDSMSREQQIGQLLMVGFSGTTATPDVLELIKSGHVGGIILFSRNLHTPRQALRLTTALQAAARAAGQSFPLLIATEQENGIVRRTGSGTTVFPGNMALGAIGSEAVTEAVARATGEELRALGITMNLAPSVDISNNPANPVIGVRSFGADPELDARLGAAATRGFQAAGVVATLKHFPGHGDTATDSHRSLPVVPFDLERLETLELVPFKRTIAEGAEAVMTAHVALPAITHSDTTPATLSPDVLQGLLRGRLGFESVIITDCLEMNAISKTVGIARGAVQALQAGADIVLISHRADRQHAGLAAVQAAVGQGDISPDAIRAAAKRVLRLKQRLPSWDELPSAVGVKYLAPAAHQQLADQTYAQSMTVIRDEAGLIPLKRPNVGRILVVTQKGAQVTQAADLTFLPDAFINALSRQLDAVAASDVAAIALPARPDDQDYVALQQQARQADAVILMTCNAHLASRITSTRAIARVLLEAGRPVIGVAVGNPYDAMALPEVRTWLATYDFLSPALEAAARVLVGVLPAPGTLPVLF